MSKLSNPSATSSARVLIHPGQFVRIKAPGAKVVVVAYEMDRGAITYPVAHPFNDRQRDHE